MNNAINTAEELESDITDKEWTVPVIDSAEQTTNVGKGFNPHKTGAWTSFAIGAVTTRVQQERNEDEAASA